MFPQDDKPVVYLRADWSPRNCAQAEKEMLKTFEYFHEYRKAKIGQESNGLQIIGSYITESSVQNTTYTSTEDCEIVGAFVKYEILPQWATSCSGHIFKSTINMGMKDI